MYGNFYEHLYPIIALIEFSVQATKLKSLT